MTLGIAFAAVGVAALAGCGNSNTAPTPAESSYYSQSPSKSTALIPKQVCLDVQKTLVDLEGNLQQVANNASGTTQAELSLLAGDLSAISPQLPAEDQQKIAGITTTLNSAGDNIAGAVEKAKGELVAAQQSIAQKCPP